MNDDLPMKLEVSENKLTPSNIINNSIQRQIIDRYIAPFIERVAASISDYAVGKVFGKEFIMFSVSIY